jgi:PemK-like, MazF-like toxin of type II toxin-antitoxin system
MKKPTLSLRRVATSSKTQEKPEDGKSRSPKLELPEEGVVLNYVYLWTHEQVTGRIEGSKERPVLVVAVDKNSKSVIVCPITTSPSSEGRTHIRIPVSLARSTMHLPRPDDSWVVVNEANKFTWVGYDLRPVSGSMSYKYGRASNNFTLSILKALLDHRAPLISRS